MGHRYGRIVTRAGDDGGTGLADGTRVPKDDPRTRVVNHDETLASSGLAFRPTDHH